MEKYVEALAVIDAINKQRTETPNAPCGWLCEMLNARIATMRPADVRPVVRCRDCDSWNEDDHVGRASLGTFRCSCSEWSSEDEAHRVFTGPDDFCSRGERKSADGN